ncbi:MAG: dihydrouridine synthase [Rickettsiales bacterium]|nr:dihydrouridine synthase [Rickettsiales bacterium]|tara:strand:+ start:4357 stop:5349 length:993 start_codon:yes stop_codon:yes gene_type:complete
MTKDFWKQLPKPILGLAPMDGYSDSAFRRVCKMINPNIITVTEFTSADGLTFNADKLKRKLWFDPSEQPVIAQIFGKNTETFIRATKVCEDMGFTGIDINMGCPSKKVVKSEHGVALRKAPDLAYRLIESVAKNTHLPVSVKTRLGWNNANDLSDFCKGAENAGADMICIHARTYKEPYNVPAQFEHLFDAKKAISIPLIANGGITDMTDGLSKIKRKIDSKTEFLDGFWIGQASFGNPWVFTPEGPPKDFELKIPVILKHAKWLIEHKGDYVGTREIRKHLLQYVKGFNGAKEYRSRLVHIEGLIDLKHVLNDLLQHIRAHSKKPILVV